MKPHKDKRGAERVEVDGELLLDINSENFIKADTVNISASGINFVSSAAVPLFRELEIKLTLPTPNKNRNVSVINCHSVVVRCVKKSAKWFDVSLFFIDMNRESKALIEEYIESKAVASRQSSVISRHPLPNPPPSRGRERER